MSDNAILLLGAGGHARSCIDVIEREGRFSIVGLVGTADEVGSFQLGYPVLGSDADLPRLLTEYKLVLVTVGQVKSPNVRMRLFSLARNEGCVLPTIVSPYAQVSRHALLGTGTIIMHGAIVNAGAQLGDNCIVNTRALIEHDATIEDHCHISTGAILNGSVRLGAGSFVGSGSTIREGVTLGKASVVGMGVAVRHDQPDGTRFVGKDKL